MQIFAEPAGKLPSLKRTKASAPGPEEVESTDHRDQKESRSSGIEAAAQQTVDAIADEAGQKHSEQSPAIASWLALIGTGLGAASHTAATACRLATTNPYMLAAGIALIAIGVGSALYFKFIY